jgi:hypothetical protein
MEEEQGGTAGASGCDWRQLEFPPALTQQFSYQEYSVASPDSYQALEAQNGQEDQQQYET